MAKDGTNRGGARPGSGPKKKAGHKFVMVPVSDLILGEIERKNIVNFAEKAISKRFSKINDK